jgi:hypothetical protein
MSKRMTDAGFGLRAAGRPWCDVSRRALTPSNDAHYRSIAPGRVRAQMTQTSNAITRIDQKG